MENDLKHFAKDISKTNVKIDLVRDEDTEKKKREMNVVIRGVLEKEDTEDRKIIETLFDNIGCKELFKDITKIERLGKKHETVQEGTVQEEREVDDAKPGRPIRLTTTSAAIKHAILKKATQVRKKDSELYNKKKIFILPDQTKLERQADIQLRKQLKETREANPNVKFTISRGKKIVRVVPVAPVQE